MDDPQTRRDEWAEAGQAADEAAGKPLQQPSAAAGIADMNARIAAFQRRLDALPADRDDARTNLQTQINTCRARLKEYQLQQEGRN